MSEILTVVPVILVRSSIQLAVRDPLISDICALSLTSHEEEEASHILHQASVPAAAQHADDPAEEDDGHRHAHETCRHSS